MLSGDCVRQVKNDAQDDVDVQHEIRVDGIRPTCFIQFNAPVSPKNSVVEKVKAGVEGNIQI
jgi:hypothetical protein